MSGGASFTPKLSPRPDYPSAFEALTKAAKSYIRIGVIGTFFVVLLHPMFVAVVNWHIRTKGLSEQTVFAILSVNVNLATYITTALFFIMCLKSETLTGYQFVRKKSQKPSSELVKQTLVDAFVSKFFMIPITSYFFYNIFRWFGMPSFTDPLPKVSRIFTGFLVSTIFNDLGFYWFHRALHHPALYGKFHKQHHNYIGTISIAAEYAGPIEQIFSNIFPTIGGCLFFGCHGSVLIYYVWMVYRLINTYETHSGFCFYGTFLHKIGLTNSEIAAYHDFHHTKNHGNFGSPFMDYLFGTMDAWMQLGACKGYVAQYRRAECMRSSTHTEDSRKVN